MFNVYYSNQLSEHKDLFIQILANDPNPDPFAQEIVLVQSLGMAQWLQMEIAQQIGLSANIQFPYPTSFIWQQYRTLFPELPKENIFARHTTVWRLMRLLPTLLDQPELNVLAEYLQDNDPLKRYQLALKIADLFDQYLVYRPQWLIAWEQGETQSILTALISSSTPPTQRQLIEETVCWQGKMWNALVADIRQDTDEIVFNTSHRAYLQQRYFEKLATLEESERQKLPPRLFVFGISSLPISQLAVLKKLSEYCNIHLFFTNPSQEFWGEQQDERVLEKLALHQRISPEEMTQYARGNPLLSIWGKQGKEFFNLLEMCDPVVNEPQLFCDFAEQDSLLASVKRAILYDQPSLDYSELQADRSIQIHACHSKMREVEVLHNALLAMFADDPHLSPKDIIVMSPDIDGYAPYINAVFSRYAKGDRRAIPFSLSDQKISHSDPIVASFLHLLSLKEANFTLEDVFSLLNVAAIREKYQLSESQLFTLREWAEQAGIRAGLQQHHPQWQNYNSWENGIARMLLGTALKEAHSPWQGVVAFDESYGLNAEMCGHFVHFLQNLTAWHQWLQQPHTAQEWRVQLLTLVGECYAQESEQLDSILLVQQSIETLCEPITQNRFNEPIDIEILRQLFEQQFQDTHSTLNFMVGKVNFCTLMPMRAIPFQVVCLLGMNEGEFPRRQLRNHFDLMQYAHQKGDRARRDDDRYLFLESLLSAQQIFYLSYIGQSLTDNQTKLPSILVSQLLDYLHTALPQCSIQPKSHPMTVFSPQNFSEGAISYDKEWLQAKSASISLPDFSTTLLRDLSELPSEVDLDMLIDYLQDPVKHFFHHHLGVHFKKEEEAVDTHEMFELSPLEAYQLSADLVAQCAMQHPQLLTNRRLKGGLPTGHFGDLAVNEVMGRVSELQKALAPYLNQPASLFEIDYTRTVSVMGETKPISVRGYIPNDLGSPQMVQWRVGKLRDKDVIRQWVYQLFLTATQSEPHTVQFYFWDKKVKKLQFKPLDNAQAKQWIAVYLHDYFANFCQLTPALTEKLGDFFKSRQKGEEEENLLRCLLEENDSPYWQRVARQTTQMDYAAFAQRTVNWFELMMQSLEIE